MLVSGKAALHANSDRHLTASWNESIVAAKYFSNMLAANETINHNVISYIVTETVHFVKDPNNIQNREMNRDTYLNY